MPDTAAAKKLDLSKLTDEEAKHVWEVVQRDFDLRKKEEDRLGELKTKLEKEDTKRELLGNQSSLAESHCIRCLQPFKFLLSGKRQCLDCQLFICKACSCYSKKEHGWLCNACHMARVLKIGTLEWYHENVRNRFKRFGSAKVMRSLFKRLSGSHSRPHSEIGEPHEYDTQSMPEVHDGYEEHSVDTTDPRYKGRKKTKRRLTVDPVDFKVGTNVSGKSRGRLSQARSDQDILVMDVGGREAVVAEANMAAAFHQILTEQRGGLDLDVTPQQDYPLPPEHRSFPLRSASRLSHSSCGSGGPRGGWGRGSSTYLPGDSEDEDDRCGPFPLYQSHLALCSHTSQESLNSANPPSQISDLDRRMSAIETLLSRIEQKVSSAHEQTSRTPSSVSPLPPLEDVDLEELQLRQKLHELTDNISDHSLSSEEENESSRPLSSQDVQAWRSPESKPSRVPTRPSSRASVMASRPGEELLHKTDPSSEDQLLDEASKTSFRGSTALLVELEDQVAQAAADVQNSESEVSFLEDRIAALNAASITVEKRRRSAIPIQARRLSHHFPTKAGNDAGLLRRRLSIM